MVLDAINSVGGIVMPKLFEALEWRVTINGNKRPVRTQSRADSSNLTDSAAVISAERISELPWTDVIALLSSLRMRRSAKNILWWLLLTMFYHTEGPQSQYLLSRALMMYRGHGCRYYLRSR